MWISCAHRFYHWRRQQFGLGIEESSLRREHGGLTELRTILSDMADLTVSQWRWLEKMLRHVLELVQKLPGQRQKSVLTYYFLCNVTNTQLQLSLWWCCLFSVSLTLTTPHAHCPASMWLVSCFLPDSWTPIRRVLSRPATDLAPVHVPVPPRGVEWSRGQVAM